MGRLGRFLIECVGNLDPLHDDDPEPERAFVDRRTNRRDRELMEWIKGQMDERGFPAAQEHEILDHLRRAIRDYGPTWSVASASDTTEKKG